MAQIYRVRAVTAGWQGAPGLTTHFFSSPGVAIAAEAQTVADRVRTGWATLVNVMSLNWSLTVQPVVDIIEDSTGLLVNSFGVTPPAVLLGNGIGGFGPTPLQGLVRWGTSVPIGGRRIQGHTFVGPVAAPLSNAPAPPSTLLGPLAAFGAAMRVSTGGAPLAVYRRPRKASPPGAPNPLPARAGAFQVATTSTVSAVWAVLTSRRD